MKQFSAREFVLLCVPVAVVAGAGFWVSRRPAAEKPRLQQGMQSPTVMQAFDGVKTVWSFGLTGENYQLQKSRVRLDMIGPQGETFWQNDTRGSIATNAFRHSRANKTTDNLKMSDIPADDIFLDYKAWVVPMNDIDSKPTLLRKRWKLDKSRIEKFDFGRPRVPVVKLKSVTVTEIEFVEELARAGTKIVCEATFVLQGDIVGKNTKLETRFRDANSWIDGFSWANNYQANSTLISTFTLDTHVYGWQKLKLPVAVISGLASVNDNWPLAFKIEPFDFKAAKVGQKLKFKSWPAPLPPGAAQ